MYPLVTARREHCRDEVDHRERKTELEPLEAAERQKKLEEWFAELEGQYRKALEAADKAEKYAQLERNGAGPV